MDNDLSGMVRRAAAAGVNFGRRLGLGSVLEYGGTRIGVIRMKKAREELLMDGGYRVNMEAAVLGGSADLAGISQKAVVVCDGERWLVGSVIVGGAGTTKLILTKEGL